MTEWISVKEQTPPEGWMLIAFKHCLDPNVLCTDFVLHIDGVFYSHKLQRTPTHWMPLPQPPEVKNE